MSATSLVTLLASKPPVEQHLAVVPTTSGFVRQSVRAILDGGYTDSQILNNALAIYRILREIVRIGSNSKHLVFPMPESGDIDILNPGISAGLGNSARRRVGLSLDFSDYDTDDLVTKRCKIESMNISVSNSSFAVNGGMVSFHRTIQAQDLAVRLSKSKPVLILDCRPFFAYNANHIQGAVNINCSDRFNRRRLQQGKCGLVDLVCSKEGKDLYKKRSSKEIIVYDDRTKDIKDITSDATLYLVLSILRREGKQASVLKGGLDQFHTDFEDLCKSCLKSQEHKPLYSPTTPIIEPAIETATASQILPFLYLGNERDAANQQRLQDLGITYVLNCTAHLPHHFENHGIKYKRLPASDSGQQNLRQYFEEACAFIDEAREAGAKLLVHCQAGVSRSATITIAYLLQHSWMSLTDAYRFTKSKRSIISPNFNFMGQLLDFEQALNQGRLQRTLIPCTEGLQSCV